MKHIKLFNTVTERNAATLETPYVIYIKETDSLEMLDVQPIESRTNPELMALCYSKGWCAREDYMTAEECAAVSDTQFNTLTATLLKDVKSLEELKYFTGLTKFPKIGLFTSVSQIEVVHFPNSMTQGWTSSNGTVFSVCSKLEKVIFPDNVTAFCGDGTNSQSLFIKVPKLKFFDISNTKLTWLGYKAIDTGVDLTGLTLPSTMVDLRANWYFTTAPKWVKLFNPVPVARLNLIAGANTRLYVPDESVDAYKEFSELSSVVNNIFPISQWQEDVDNEIIVAE